MKIREVKRLNAALLNGKRKITIKPPEVKETRKKDKLAQERTGGSKLIDFQFPE